MAEKRENDKRVTYQIKVLGKLDAHWSDWFSGLTILIASECPPVTILTGAVDQAGLRGILSKIWDLNLTLHSVVPMYEKEEFEGVQDAD